MKFLLQNYINNISNQDIINFGLKNDITINASEASFLKSIVKSNIDDILKGNDEATLQILSNKFDSLRYKKIKNLYLIYKQKYKNYL